jgi:hypothetical protein
MEDKQEQDTEDRQAQNRTVWGSEEEEEEMDTETRDDDIIPQDRLGLPSGSGSGF